LFIIEGAMTVVIAASAFFVLPNFPRTTKWLTDEERELAVWRLQEDIGVDDWVDSKSQSFWGGFSLAVKDIKVWILMLMLLGIVSAGSVTNFFPSVVKTLNYDNITTLLLTAPPYILAVITVFCNAVHADKTGERTFHVILPLIVAIAAFILAAATTSTAPRYVAMLLMVSHSSSRHDEKLQRHLTDNSRSRESTHPTSSFWLGFQTPSPDLQRNAL
jgi:flagellar basal body-associated protein FliL